MSTLTAEQEQRIAQFLDGRHIPSGLGTKEEACSIAAINLALRGELTGAIPPCMSPTIGQWILVVQDRMPDAMRNSEGWRKLLPLAAGSAAPEKERARVEIILGWMWETVLPSVQSIADAHGFGREWRVMCEERSQTAAEAARAAAAAWAAKAARVAAWVLGEGAVAAWMGGEVGEGAVAVAAWMGGEVGVAAEVARMAGAVARMAGEAKAAEAWKEEAAAWATATATAAAAWATATATEAAAWGAEAAAWERFAPVALLEQLIAV